MLDVVAAPNNYAVPFTEAEISHILRFRRICKQYNIQFTTATQAEKDFVIALADADNR